MRKSRIVIAILVALLAVALFMWFTKSKRCLKKDRFQDMMQKSCPPFQMWDGSKCICDYPNGIVWDSEKNECVCDARRGFSWNGLKCIRPIDIPCPGDEYFDWTSNMCIKP
ncbi:hypothetical protein ATCVNEJV3_561L [Acanthocystis turfacea Chlorella virus NE-JV-3]|nr:hypothetical protein ATCVCan0610SP_559L [Acanthocystis turfacea Chlorella virus Can0610SP]AGE57012.1 hypothetical protein ATCVNEJV3_561L [Acanthocystis turfacea Chlorella virus NE-JV-3]